MTNPAQQFCVRWNSYQSNLQNAFPKLLINENFVDVTLACEAQMIKCHKVVLSACSSYFESLLSQNPCQHPIIFMKDMKFWEIRALVDFMYRGEVNVTQEELQNLLRAAEALQVRGLYGYEQQRSAAVTQTSESTNGEAKNNVRETTSTPMLPANTTLQECKSQARSGDSSAHEDSNDQMVKIEEEIMMMEEHSISDSSHLDNDFTPLDSSQEFDGFVGDQRYPPPSGALDPEQGAGPSGLTMTPSLTPPTMQQDNKLMGQSQQMQQQPYGHSSWPVHQRWSHHLSSPQQHRKRQQTSKRASVASSGKKSKNHTRAPNKWNTLPKVSCRLQSYSMQNMSCHMPNSGQLNMVEDELGLNSPIKRIRRSERELSEAAGLISRGLTFQSVSDRYKIPISTIRFYMARRGILPRRKRGRTNRFDEMDPKHDSPEHSQQNGPPMV